MPAVIRSLCLNGLEAVFVRVEVEVHRGLPHFVIIGLPDKAVQEARERVLTALQVAGYQLPLRKIVVNLAPADLRKQGGKFDLPIALGILMASGALTMRRSGSPLVLGELSLTGEVRPVAGILAMALGALAKNERELVVPLANQQDVHAVPGLRIAPVATLDAARRFLEGEGAYRENSVTPVEAGQQPAGRPCPDTEALAEVRGQVPAVRAAVIAAAGGHHLLLYGPPGVGKTMLARRIPGLLPAMCREETLETNALYSLYQWNEKGATPGRDRPFRAPHHASSDIAIVGGGPWPRPGEISLAHNGILFLDEFQEFRPSVLDMLRQPLQDRRIVLARSAGAVAYPADFLLVAAMNPCPCGRFLGAGRRCQCTGTQIRRHFQRLSAPLLDRIDLQIEMPAPAAAGDDLTIDPAAARTWLGNAARLQAERYAGSAYRKNGDVPGEALARFLGLDAEAARFARSEIPSRCPSSRARDSVLRVGRTIADLEGEPVLRVRHLLEALVLRDLEARLEKLDAA